MAIPGQFVKNDIQTLWFMYPTLELTHWKPYPSQRHIPIYPIMWQYPTPPSRERYSYHQDCNYLNILKGEPRSCVFSCQATGLKGGLVNLLWCNQIMLSSGLNRHFQPQSFSKVWQLSTQLLKGLSDRALIKSDEVWHWIFEKVKVMIENLNQF